MRRTAIAIGLSSLLASGPAHATCWRKCQIVPMFADCTVPARRSEWPAATPLTLSAWCDHGCDAPGVRNPPQTTEMDVDSIRVAAPSGQPIAIRFRPRGKTCGEIPLVELDHALSAGDYTLGNDNARVSLRVTSGAAPRKPAVECKTVCRLAPRFTDCTEPMSALYWPPSVPLTVSASCVESCGHVRRSWSEPTAVPLDRLHVNEHPWPDRGQVPGAFRSSNVTCAGEPLFTFDGVLARDVRYNVLVDEWATLQIVTSGTLERKHATSAPPASEPRRGGCSGCTTAALGLVVLLRRKRRERDAGAR